MADSFHSVVEHRARAAALELLVRIAEANQRKGNVPVKVRLSKM